METPLEIYELPHWDFRLERTEGKYYNYIYKIIYLERTSNNPNSEYDMQCFGTLRWGCQDLQKKDLIRAVRTSTGRFLRSFEQEALKKTASLKKPRSASKQKSFEDKLKAQIQSMEKVVDICEQTILAQCNYTLVGENAMGKILTILRDNGSIDHKFDYPLFLFDNEIK